MNRCLLNTAMAERGVREIPGRRDNARIVEYLRTTNYPIPPGYIDEIPWCAAFLNWLCVMCKLPRTGSAWSQSWLDWGNECDEEVGAVVIFRWNDVNGHVGVIKAIDEDGIYVIGGNQRNSVCIAFYSRDYIVGYRKIA